MAVAGAEQVMCPNIVGLLLQFHELGEQFLAFWRVGVVDFVVADVGPVVRQLALCGTGVDSDVNLLR